MGSGDMVVHEVERVDSGVLTAITKAELDVQVTTARAFPRSLKRFLNECDDLVTLSEAVAAECYYCLPRDGKTIEGPSARLAEIVASCWGNSRITARVVDETEDFVVAQGVFHDLQTNVAIGYEVRRRITGRNGRFTADMIAVTANAACSIALRNAVFKGVPKALWVGVYEKARATVRGDVTTLADRRAAAMTYLQKFSVTPDRVFAALTTANPLKPVEGVEDIGLDELDVLRGMLNLVKSEENTVDELFPDPKAVAKAAAKASGTGVAGIAAALAPTPAPVAATPPAKTALPDNGWRESAVRALAASNGISERADEWVASDLTVEQVADAILKAKGETAAAATGQQSIPALAAEVAKDRAKKGQKA